MFKLDPGILYGDFFLFYMQLFLQLLSSILQSVNFDSKNMLWNYFSIILFSLITESN